MVFADLPFALVGGILAMFLLGINLSVSAAIGFIALFGTAVGNGVVLVAFFNQLKQEGLPTDAIVRKGCELRFRPLLMTALAMLLGLVPMLFATGNGCEIQRPLSAVVLGGLFSSMFLTLLVLPAIYNIFESRREKEVVGTE